MSHSPAQLYTQPTFLELFTPKLITVFCEGYGWRDLRADAVSGLGFTAGIAVIIAASQIRDLLGLASPHEPSSLLPKLLSIRNALPTLHIPTVGIAIMSVVVIVTLRHLRPNWPSFLIAVSVAAIVCAVFPIVVATVHSRFGAIPGLLSDSESSGFQFGKDSGGLARWYRDRTSRSHRVALVSRRRRRHDRPPTSLEL
jgi:hypothetical protein